MGNEKSELEKLIAQAEEMVGPTGSVWLASDQAAYRNGGRWSITLQTSRGWKVNASDFPTAVDAIRGGIKRLLDSAGSASDEAQRLLHIARSG